MLHLCKRSCQCGGSKGEHLEEEVGPHLQMFRVYGQSALSKSHHV